jgi:MscS family membrane protein
MRVDKSHDNVNSLLSLLVFAAVAKIADVLVNRVFRKFARFTKSDVDDRIIDVIHRPIYFTIILIGCAFAVAYLKGSPGIIFYADSTVYSVISVVWAITAMTDLIRSEITLFFRRERGAKWLR